MSQMDPDFYYYSKFVSLKKDEASEVVTKIHGLFNSNDPTNDGLIFCELGSGWGNISVPVIHQLIEEKLLKEWYGFEKDKNKISYLGKLFTFYQDPSNRTDYDKSIDELRNNQRCSGFKTLVFNINKTTTATKIKNLILVEFDLEDTKKFNEKINNKKIDVLFVPFIFQHLKNWRKIFEILLLHTNNKLIVVAGELEGDWETCFSPYKVSAYNEWRTFFQKIWKDNTIIPTSLRDYKHYNVSVFSTFIENQGFNIKELLECPLKLEIKTSERELLHHLKHRVWSPFIQNFNSGNPRFIKEDFSKDIKVFNSIHNFNIYQLEKR